MPGEEQIRQRIPVEVPEAGGTERTWELYEAGAPKITEELIAEGLEASKQWIGAAIDLQIALHAEYVLALTGKTSCGVRTDSLSVAIRALWKLPSPNRS